MTKRCNLRSFSVSQNPRKHGQMNWSLNYVKVIKTRTTFIYVYCSVGKSKPLPVSIPKQSYAILTLPEIPFRSAISSIGACNVFSPTIPEIFAQIRLSYWELIHCDVKCSLLSALKVSFFHFLMDRNKLRNWNINRNRHFMKICVERSLVVFLNN